MEELTAGYLIPSRSQTGEGEARSLPTDSYSTLSCFLKSALRVLDSEGIDGAQLFEEQGIPISDYQDRSKRAPNSIIRSAWRIVAEKIDDPAVGIRAALHQINPADWQSLGLAILCSGTIRQALERVTRYFDVVSNAGGMRLETTENELILIGTTYDDPAEVVWSFLEFGVASLLVLLQEVYPRPLIPTRIALMRPESLASDQFEKLLHCPVSFGAKSIRICFDISIADEQLLASNESLAAYQDSYSMRYLAWIARGTTPLRVKREIMKLLPGSRPRIVDVARTMNISSRQLQRKLAKNDIKFEALVTDIRKQLSLSYLRGTNYSISEVAFLLGYSSQSNFTRAFRDWFDVTPTEYRIDSLRASGASEASTA